MKKSEQTKAKLVDAVIKLINKGQKISVASITKEAKTAYGSFYRYFNNLEEVHEAAIIDVAIGVAEDLDKKLEKEKSNLFKVYYSWYIAIDLYKDTYTATLPALTKHGFLPIPQPLTGCKRQSSKKRNRASMKKI
jgi:AcrR family transcriptional regulator